MINKYFIFNQTNIQEEYHLTFYIVKKSIIIYIII